MAGSKAGGAKAAKTNKLKYGEDFYAKIGALGGKIGRTGGFYANRELARIAGRKGGLKSKRGPSAQNNKNTVSSKTKEQGREDLLQNNSDSERGRSNWLLRHLR